MVFVVLKSAVRNRSVIQCSSMSHLLKCWLNMRLWSLFAFNLRWWCCDQHQKMAPRSSLAKPWGWCVWLDELYPHKELYLLVIQQSPKTATVFMWFIRIHHKSDVSLISTLTVQALYHKRCAEYYFYVCHVLQTLRSVLLVWWIWFIAGFMWITTYTGCRTS